jgi:hypothetical protein
MRVEKPAIVPIGLSRLEVDGSIFGLKRFLHAIRAVGGTH